MRGFRNVSGEISLRVAGESNRSISMANFRVVGPETTL